MKATHELNVLKDEIFANLNGKTRVLTVSRLGFLKIEVHIFREIGLNFPAFFHSKKKNSALFFTNRKKLGLIRKYLNLLEIPLHLTTQTIYIRRPQASKAG